jgi:hypothetical protein
LNAHGGAKVTAPQALGSLKHRPVMDAPGAYALAAA